MHLPLLRRDPHYFLPTTGDRYLLFGSDTDATRRQFEVFFSREDWLADCRLQVAFMLSHQRLLRPVPFGASCDCQPTPGPLQMRRRCLGGGGGGGGGGLCFSRVPGLPAINLILVLNFADMI